MGSGRGLGLGLGCADACAARPAYSLLLTTYYLLLTPDSLLFRCVCRAADAERVAALALELATGGKRGGKGGKAGKGGGPAAAGVAAAFIGGSKPNAPLTLTRTQTRAPNPNQALTLTPTLTRQAERSCPEAAELHSRRRRRHAQRRRQQVCHALDSNPRLADAADRSATHTFEPRLGQR